MTDEKEPTPRPTPLNQDEVALELMRFIAHTTGMGKHPPAQDLPEKLPRRRRSKWTHCFNSLSAAGVWSGRRIKNKKDGGSPLFGKPSPGQPGYFFLPPFFLGAAFFAAAFLGAAFFAGAFFAGAFFAGALWAAFLGAAFLGAAFLAAAFFAGAFFAGPSSRQLS